MKQKKNTQNFQTRSVHHHFSYKKNFIDKICQNYIAQTKRKTCTQNEISKAKFSSSSDFFISLINRVIM